MRKRKTHFNELRPDEAERLALALEEMAEATQVIGKILRHGYGSYNPFDKDRVSNRDLLEREIGDVKFAISLLCQHDLDLEAIRDRVAEKSESVYRYLHHNAAKK